MSEAAPDNSTFAQRAQARGARKQMVPGQALNKAVTMGTDDERLNDPEAEKDHAPEPPPTSPPSKTRGHK